MTRYYQFTETRNASAPQKYVLQYDDIELSEVFKPHELDWLKEGKIVERESVLSKTEIVDMQAWFERTKAL